MAARDLRQASIDLFGRTPQIVINSHWHSDHVWGNQVFIDDACIISSMQTRQMIAVNGPIEEARTRQTNAQEIADLETQMNNASKDEQHELKLWLNLAKAVNQTLSELSLCLPDITFEKRLKLFGSKQVAELIEFNNGHTVSDVILYLEKDGILFSGDLLFAGFHAYLCDGNPENWKNNIRSLLQMNARHIIPGHGTLASNDHLLQEIDYIDFCLETVKSFVSENGTFTEEKTSGLRFPPPFDKLRAPAIYLANIKSLCQQNGSARID
jgi:glyoxylase-like metal-dependent hydrolase (beta-lactamase superfamily II)